MGVFAGLFSILGLGASTVAIQIAVLVAIALSAIVALSLIGVGSYLFYKKVRASSSAQAPKEMKQSAKAAEKKKVSKRQQKKGQGKAPKPPKSPEQEQEAQKEQAIRPELLKPSEKTAQVKQPKQLDANKTPQSEIPPTNIPAVPNPSVAKSAAAPVVPGDLSALSESELDEPGFQAPVLPVLADLSLETKSAVPRALRPISVARALQIPALPPINPQSFHNEEEYLGVINEELQKIVGINDLNSIAVSPKEGALLNSLRQHYMSAAAVLYKIAQPGMDVQEHQKAQYVMLKAKHHYLEKIYANISSPYASRDTAHLLSTQAALESTNNEMLILEETLAVQIALELETQQAHFAPSEEELKRIRISLEQADPSEDLKKQATEQLKEDVARLMEEEKGYERDSRESMLREQIQTELDRVFSGVLIPDNEIRFAQNSYLRAAVLCEQLNTDYPNTWVARLALYSMLQKKEAYFKQLFKAVGSPLSAQLKIKHAFDDVQKELKELESRLMRRVQAEILEKGYTDPKKETSFKRIVEDLKGQKRKEQAQMQFKQEVAQFEQAHQIVSGVALAVPPAVVNNTGAIPVLVQPVLTPPQAMQPKTPKVLCIDWDFTITDMHTHNTLRGRTNTPKELSPCYDDMGNAWDGPLYLKVKDRVLVHKLPPKKFTDMVHDINYFFSQHDHDPLKKLINDCSFREAESMRALISDALAHGDKVAIVSFNQYPHIMPAILTRLGLTPEEIDKLIIVSNFPIKDGADGNKNEHIDFVKQIIEEEEDILVEDQDIMLIDDSVTNTEAAKQKGYAVVEATRGKPIDFARARDFLELPQPQLVSRKTPL